MFEPFLKKFISELEDKFTANNAMSVFSHLMYTKDWTCDDETKHQIKILFDFYEMDLNDSFPSVLDEIELWQKKLDNLKEKPISALNHMKLCNEHLFPNVKKLLKIYNVIPVTTAQIERSFSKLGLIKTEVRNSTGQERLEGFMFLSIQRNVTVTFDEFLTEFKKSCRRLDI